MSKTASLSSALEALLGCSGVTLADVYAYAAAHVEEQCEGGRWENEVWVTPESEKATVAPPAP